MFSTAGLCLSVLSTAAGLSTARMATSAVSSTTTSAAWDEVSPARSSACRSRVDRAADEAPYQGAEAGTLLG